MMMLILLTFFLTCQQWNSVLSQFILYESDRPIKTHVLYYDCLNYRKQTIRVVYQHLIDIIDDLIPYCVQPVPVDVIDEIENDVADEQGTRMSFRDIRSQNINVSHLMDWSVPVDIIERYQKYVNIFDDESNEYFYNCTQPWFGHRCQYSFNLDRNQSSFDEIVEQDFARRSGFVEYGNMPVLFPCYVLLVCDRGGSSLCLDWREICDGTVDCLDGGHDEEFCFDMEMNECGEHEYRCHNGLCIPKDLWENGLGEADCLDRSDDLLPVNVMTECYHDPSFRCEEYSCTRGTYTFVCGDGQCIEGFNKCQNGRHALLRQSFSMQGNLSEKCWISMVCLTGLMDAVNGSTCKNLLSEGHIDEYVSECDAMYEFPLIPIYSDHVRFVYTRVNNLSRAFKFLPPDYICYDPQWCDFPMKNVIFHNYSCIPMNEAPQIQVFDGLNLLNVFTSVKEYFTSCRVKFWLTKNDLAHQNHSSLYNCLNSSKLISKHRLVDLINDCHLEDDETFNDSCSLKDPFRIRCPDNNVCYASILVSGRCVPLSKTEYEWLLFKHLCNGIKDNNIHATPEKSITVDESNCNEVWPCDNMYTRCDGFRSCADGKDESNCNRSVCPAGTHECVSPTNYSVLCLPAKYVNDDHDDCLGASDEPLLCRVFLPYIENPARFRCLNSWTCVSSLQLCDGTDDCLTGRDDEVFCGNHRDVCNKERQMTNRTLVEDLLCGLSEQESKGTPYTSIHTSSDFPLTSMTTIDDWIVPLKSTSMMMITRIQENKKQEYRWPWYCNRGIEMNLTSIDDNQTMTCLCPASYYGHRCQYQSQRISLTLQLISIYRSGIYRIISLLIDDNDEKRAIESYDQYLYFVQQSCSVKINRYLLFTMRPKDYRRNYSIHIHVIEMNTMKHVGTWYFPIPFLFLPVNRIVGQIIIPIRPKRLISQCPNSCQHGQCLIYMNTNRSYCYCDIGWSGIRCDQQRSMLNISSHCSKMSIDMGTIKNRNRSLCICPLNRFGRDCSSDEIQCPDEMICHNQGQCIISIDMSQLKKNYLCLCPHDYYGEFCQYRKARIEMTIDNLMIPSYILAYFFTLSNQSEVEHTMILQKLTLFQRHVIFRITIPYNVIVVEISKRFYLVALQKKTKQLLKTSIHSKQECQSFDLYLNSYVLSMKRYDRIKYYHQICQQYESSVQCFYDEAYLCLCTNERHANCLSFERNPKELQCHSDHICLNGAYCLQDHPRCPSTQICVCDNCFFGSQCQYYAKGLGATLDEILGYEIQFHTHMFHQRLSVQITFIMTLIMFLIGFINGLCSILTFSRKKTTRSRLWNISLGIIYIIFICCNLVYNEILILIFILSDWKRQQKFDCSIELYVYRTIIKNDNLY